MFFRDDGPEIYLCAVVVVAEARRTTPAAAHVVSIFSPLGLFRSLYNGIGLLAVVKWTFEMYGERDNKKKCACAACVLVVTESKSRAFLFWIYVQ